jgi:hypothetical protein
MHFEMTPLARATLCLALAAEPEQGLGRISCKLVAKTT